LDDLFHFVRSRPTSLFVVVEFFLQGIHLKAHIEGQLGDTTAIVATGAIERLPKGENRTYARQ